MGLSNITVKTFNSSGAQSICRANNADDTKLIESQFLTKCTTEYINGSGETVIPGSLSVMPTTTLYTNSLNHDTFQIDSDIDAISSMDLTVGFDIDMSTPSELSAAGDHGADGPVLISKDFILSFIAKIEIRMGGLVVQTIQPEEIFMRNLTELNNDSTNNFYNGLYDCDGSDVMEAYRYLERADAYFGGATAASTATPPGDMKIKKVADSERYALMCSTIKFPTVQIEPKHNSRFSGTVSIPFIGRALNMQRAFLQAGAITNSFTVKVFYNQTQASGQGNSKQGGDSTTRSRGSAAFFRFLDQTDAAPRTANFRTFLTVRNHTMTETEKNFISGNIINRIVNTSQTVAREITTGEVMAVTARVPRNGMSSVSDVGTGVLLGVPKYSTCVLNAGPVSKQSSTKQIVIDLSSIDINVSHLLISARAPCHTNNGELWCGGSDYEGDATLYWTGAGAALTTVGIYQKVQKSELFKFSGYTPASKEKLVGNDGGNMRGILCNWLDSAELILGGDRTGNLPASQMLQCSESFGLKSPNVPIYIIPIADSAFSTAGVPFARVGIKKLVLNVKGEYAITGGPFTNADNAPGYGAGLYPIDSSSSPNTAAGDPTFGPRTRIAVTCCGTQVQTTVGGTISFAA